MQKKFMFVSSLCKEISLWAIQTNKVCLLSLAVNDIHIGIQGNMFFFFCMLLNCNIKSGCWNNLMSGIIKLNKPFNHLDTYLTRIFSARCIPSANEYVRNVLYVTSVSIHFLTHCVIDNGKIYLLHDWG